jgi:4-hydroxythreonine-4-phosphate dehydrogenase
MNDKPILAVTMGDPAGVGPEVAVRALADPRVHQWCRPFIVGDSGAIRQAADLWGIDLPIRELAPTEAPGSGFGTIEVLPVSHLKPEELEPGRPTPAGGRAAAEFIETAAQMALAGRVQGMVTGPISKEALNQAGRRFPGHTEFLSEMAGGADVVMMLAGEKLRVVLVTIHIALADVPGRLTEAGVLRTVRITHRALKDSFGLASPRLAVAALNPHAGEGGLFGREEETVIAPAVAKARREGIVLTDPLPPDTVFVRAAAGEFDAVVCMYHDQGLIPLKLLHFKDAVNVTLGLPFIRTSVDHGTAYDIAGQKKADSSSMTAALKMAAEMAARTGTAKLASPIVNRKS